MEWALWVRGIIGWLKTNQEAIAAAHDVIVGLAALVGGLWVILRLKRERTDEDALSIEVSSTTSPYGSEFSVFFDIRLHNVGKTKIQAKPSRAKAEYAYDDSVEKLLYSGSLQLQRVVITAVPAGGRVLDWFDKSGRLEAVPDLPEMNLLSCYEDPNNDNRVDFWMEPGEIYSVGASVILPAGLYLAKITFIASRSDRNFWTRMIQLHIPKASNCGPDDSVLPLRQSDGK
jgi:hypothetical protein